MASDTVVNPDMTVSYGFRGIMASVNSKFTYAIGTELPLDYIAGLGVLIFKYFDIALAFLDIHLTLYEAMIVHESTSA